MKRAFPILLTLLPALVALTLSAPLLNATAMATTAQHAKTAAKPASKSTAKKSRSKYRTHRTARQTTAARPAMPTLVVPSSDPGLLPDMTIGNPNAAVTVTEYASAACPHCAAWNAENWDAFEAKYLVTGKVRYVFRELLTSPQEYALSGFMIGRCAVAASSDPTNSRPYFAVLQTYYAGQIAYGQSGQMGMIENEITKKTGLSKKAQLDCVSDGPKFTAFMASMRAHTTADKVSSTPTFFVNGKRLDSHDMKDIDAAIAAASH